jgi:hypothetical protein
MNNARETLEEFCAQYNCSKEQLYSILDIANIRYWIDYLPVHELNYFPCVALHLDKHPKLGQYLQILCFREHLINVINKYRDLIVFI